MKSFFHKDSHRSPDTIFLRRMVCLLLIVLLCCNALSCFSEEESLTATEGDSELQITIQIPMRDVLANLSSGEESLLASVEQKDNNFRLFLTRPLRAGEDLRLLLSGTDSEGQVVEISRSGSVGSLFSNKLSALSCKAGEFRSAWIQSWLPLIQQGKVDIPVVWRNLPFALWPDEAPEIKVVSAESSTRIYLSESLPADWRLCTGKDIPVVYSPCDYDDVLGAWITGEEFESVFLIHDMTGDSAGITIEYKTGDAFRASYPVVEYILEEKDTTSAFNSYGWGTSRSFDGGMYALVAEETVVYAEYGPDRNGALINYSIPAIDCSFDPEGNLISGNLPEGFENPVKVY